MVICLPAMQIAYRSEYHHQLPEGHRFPMVKYELIPRQLIYEGTFNESAFFKPGPVDEKWILTVHTPAYWKQLKNLLLPTAMIRRIGFPLDEGLVFRERVIVQGTIDCALHALDHGIALNVAGGTHHAYADKGEGFCLLNDMAVAARYLLDNNLAKRVMIVDLDVHQGNGSAAIFANEPRVFTFSMHGQENYPLRKEISDMDIALPTHCTDEEYLTILYQTLPHLIETQRPDFIFLPVGSGCDL